MQKACPVKSGFVRTGAGGSERGMEQAEEVDMARSKVWPGRKSSPLDTPAFANGSTLQPAESDASHNMALQRKEEDDDRNDSQSRAGHLQLILVVLLHAQVGNRDRQLLL